MIQKLETYRKKLRPISNNNKNSYKTLGGGRTSSGTAYLKQYFYTAFRIHVKQRWIWKVMRESDKVRASAFARGCTCSQLALLGETLTLTADWRQNFPFCREILLRTENVLKNSASEWKVTSSLYGTYRKLIINWFSVINVRQYTDINI